jgi:hypothetical protein
VKILKHKYLITEIQHMWNVKAKVIPVVTEATVTTSKSFRQYLCHTTGKHKIKEMQRTAIMGTVCLLRQVLT